MKQRSVISSDGYLRRAFTVDEVDAMVAAGLIDPDERLEIIDGEIFPMSAKGPLHETLKRHLNRHLARELPAAFGHTQEAGWRLGPMLYLEPDFVVYPEELEIDRVDGRNAALVIEIADTSFRYDSTKKAGVYASIGVREYWIVDAGSRTTHVFREPQPRGFGFVEARPASDRLEPLFIPGYAVRLADLGGL